MNLLSNDIFVKNSGYHIENKRMLTVFEVEFYKQEVANARKLHPQGRFDTNIEYRNVGGVGVKMPFFGFW